MVKVDSNLSLLFVNRKNDILAGLVVSLMALPMSLGIALASGFPPMAGIIAAVVGGVLVSFLSGSELTIKGPAGGLSAIAFGAVITLGNGQIADGYRYALAAIVVAGAISMAFGLARLGALGDFFPASTIHGMLAALGIIMAIKQIHPALGVNPTGKTPFELLVEIPNSIFNLNPKILLISIVSLGILIVIPKLTQFKIGKVPAPLVVILAIIPLSFVLEITTNHQYVFGLKTFTVDPKLLLIDLPDNIWSGITFPDFSKIASIESLQYIVMFAFAGAIESLLSTKAIDKLDPLSRISNQNRDLFAVGFGTMVSGFLGGLPIISESKRSVINISHGATSRWANFFQGLFLALIIAIGIRYIKLIPYAALATLLVYTGARMATPREFSKSYQIGKEQFLVFIITFIATFMSNFIVGVGLGLLTELIIHLRFGVGISALFKTDLKLLKDKEGNFEVVFNGPAIFSNYLGVKNIIDKIPPTSNITFDFSKATVVDHTFMEQLHGFETRKIEKGGQIAIVGLDYHKHLSTHPLAAKRIVKQRMLNERQQLLQKMCLESELKFEHRTINNSIKFAEFTFSQGALAKVEENVISYSYREYLIEISDIFVEQGGQNVVKQDYKMTAMVIKTPSGLLPNFTLLKEGFVDTLLAMSGFNDIDFVEFPNFSYYYLLNGSNELHVRNFFKEDIIRFFEQHREFQLESHNNQILLFKRTGLLTEEEIESMMHYTRQLIDLLIFKIKN